jgi:hypothetical protein
MCDHESDGTTDARIDQGLYEAARRIETSLAGKPAPDEAWQIFFGRSGGAVIWSDYQRIRGCYLKAERGARLSTMAVRSSALVCEPVAS